ncbi:hypothetical protein [Chryseosolibacter indicus]|uniref:DUF4369 domain-containing protein n=1 Tax=Chryseosolibacter indicus TaxID=2782351 RepID=A0ABS5VQ30_9BACT|nr:hypothetical protein [Chryseosolibacter indicus]MBT1702889.1 hypothetical protein [Chryseosolibacter indicus]
MKRILFIWIILLSALALRAGTTWNEGSVVLKTGEVLSGFLQIKPEYDIVLFKTSNNEQIEVFPAHKICSAFVHDTFLNINRKFTSIKQGNDVFSTSRLYEVVLQGEVSVLRRHLIDRYDEQKGSVSYAYFVLDNENLVNLKEFKNKIYPKLLQSERKLSKYVQEQNLGMRDLSSTIKVIRFYNKQRYHNPTVSELNGEGGFPNLVLEMKVSR